MRSGELFAGVGGLGMAVDEVFGSAPGWFCEMERGPSRALEYHYPGVPNLGDVTGVDWSEAPPVQVLAGGFPCQDVSMAGRRAGLRDGTRSGLWSEFARAIDVIRPDWVVIENVRGLLSAEAHSDLERCPWCVGDGSGEPALRALGAVLGSLAELGFDAEWVGLRAADVGAPHGRYRVVILAWPAEFTGSGGRSRRISSTTSDRGAAAHADSARWGREGRPDGDGYPSPDPAVGSAWWDDAHGYGVAAPDSGGVGRWWGASKPGRASRLRRPAVLDPAAGDNSTPPDSGRIRRFSWGSAGSGEEACGWSLGHLETRVLRDTWGDYAPAVERWEDVFGRPAPAPTRNDGKGGAARLNPELPEWMMGWPAGWVTDPGVGLSRSEQLKACGNGVVPQQVAAALRELLRRPGVPEVVVARG